VAHVRSSNRIEVQELTDGFHRVIAHYGFMDEPDIPDVVASCKNHGLEISPQQITYFLSRETIIPSTRKRGMMLWRERLFRIMAQNAQSATAFFRLPANRVVELGMQVEI